MLIRESAAPQPSLCYCYSTCERKRERQQKQICCVSLRLGGKSRAL